MASTFKKDPLATLDYSINWRPLNNPWLEVGETILASTWTVDVGIVQESDTFDADTTTIWLSGGVANTRYRVSNRITSSLGRIDERSFFINVVELFV